MSFASFRSSIGHCVRHLLVALVALGLSWGLRAAEAVNLLQLPVCFRGSSFRATPKYVATITTNYYTMVADGKPSTHWEPLEEKGPHFLEMIWQQPVRIHTAKWLAEGMAQAKLSRWTNQIIAMPNRVLGSLDVARPDFPNMLPPVQEVKIGDNAAGQRGFIINGNWHPAFFNRFYGHPDPERIAAFGENGLKILLLMVHNGYDGRRTETIRLPKPARVTDLFTGAPVAKGASFELTLESPQTRLLRLDYEGN